MNILITVQNKIPSLYYGGTERVVWCLGKELHKLGHTITFLAPTGSYCDFAEVIIYDNSKSINEQIPEHIELVHVFDDDLKEIISKPHLVTIEGNPSFEKTLNINCVFVSKNHANRYNSESFVYNGLDWDMYNKPDLNSKRDYFHFLGNAAWNVKNVRGVINSVRLTDNEKVHVLGGNRFHPNTFTLSIRIKFEGMVNDDQKSVLMNKSKGLIFPVLWHEPFGLAITESLFYGCPVFGTPYGSLFELVPEEFGFLTDNQLELSKALSNSDSYSKTRCNEYVVEEFNSKKMAFSYLDKYEIVLNGNNLNQQQPKLISDNVGLLPWRT